MVLANLVSPFGYKNGAYISLNGLSITCIVCPCHIPTWRVSVYQLGSLHTSQLATMHETQSKHGESFSSVVLSHVSMGSLSHYTPRCNLKDPHNILHPKMRNKGPVNN